MGRIEDKILHTLSTTYLYSLSLLTYHSKRDCFMTSHVHSLNIKALNSLLRMFSFLSEACWKTASPSEVISYLYLQHLNQLSEMKILSYCTVLLKLWIYLYCLCILCLCFDFSMARTQYRYTFNKGLMMVMNKTLS